MPYTLIRLSSTHIARYARFLAYRLRWVPPLLRENLSRLLLHFTLYRHAKPNNHFTPFTAQVNQVLHIKWRVVKWKWRLLKHILRWKWHLAQRFWDLPRWLKLLKLTAMLLAVAGYYGWGYIKHEREVQAIFDEYYPHYYNEYRKKNVSQARASHYAAYYARYYAEYYASDAYKEALSYALPKPSREAFHYPRKSKNASLTLAPADIKIIPEPEVRVEEPEEETLSPTEQAPEENALQKPNDAATEALLLPPQVAPQPYVPAVSTNASSLEMIKAFEGLSYVPYLDSGKRLTIGYGHLIRRGEVWTKISPAEAEALLVQDIRLAEAAVKREVQVELTPNQFAALVSLVYNIGPGHFEKSTLLKKLNRRDTIGASWEFLRWKYVGKQEVKGLTRRRQQERALFLLV